VCRSLEEFYSLLSEILQCFGMLQEPWRSGFLCVARMDPLHLLNPSKNPHLCQHIAIAQFVQWVMLFKTQLAFVCCLPCSPLWVEISTMAYETNSSCWPERLSLANCTHIIQTKLMLKNRRYPQKSMFTDTGGPIDMPHVVLR